MNTILPLLLAPAVSAVANAIEHQPGIPYEGKTKAGITAALFGISLALRFALAAYQGQLNTLDLATDGRLFLEAAIAALSAAGGYSLVKSDKPTL
jgi:hypothetical protein